MEEKSTFSFVLILTCFCSLYCVIASDFIATKEIASGKIVFTKNKTNAVAWGNFTNDINKTGWSHLEVYSSSKFADLAQAYSAGLVEGKLTKQLIGFQLANNADLLCIAPLSPLCMKLRDFLNVNLAWIHAEIARYSNDTYWHQIAMLLAQINGVRDGYLNKPGSPTYVIPDPLDQFLLLQIFGDAEDLSQVLVPGSPHILGAGSCSALIKLLPNHSDILVSQVTWNTYQNMIRILKKYDLQLHTSKGGGPTIPGQVMTFSSYPGLVSSGDDFYTIDSGLVTLETTIGNSNADLWKYVVPKGAVMEGLRSMTANRLATSGKQWATIFSLYNSGTYNNQWMIVDMKKFQPGYEYFWSDLLWVVEQIPNHIESHDMTDILKNSSYWPSYNVPFYETIFNESGHQEAVKKFGDWFTYEKNPRAQIFRRDQGKVNDTQSMIRLMRYNDYTHDNLSVCNCTPPYSAENAISARSDLNPASGHYPFGALGHRAHGATDMKLTSLRMASQLEFIAQSSPAFDNVPPFQWSKSDYATKLKHVGMPDLWKFAPIHHQWGARHD